jgi:hypothetical protein
VEIEQVGLGRGRQVPHHAGPATLAQVDDALEHVTRLSPLCPAV